MEKVRGLPKAFNNIINSSYKYSDFMKRVIKEMEENINFRIENKKLDI